MGRERSERRRGRGGASRAAPTKQAAPGVSFVPRGTRAKIVSRGTPKSKRRKILAPCYIAMRPKIAV